MLEQRSIAVIGAGNLGSALLFGLAQMGQTSPHRLIAADSSAERLAAISARHSKILTTSSNTGSIEKADIVVLAVKPNVVAPVVEEIAGALRPNQLLISMAAAVPIAAIEESLDSPQPIVRVMPNIAMTVHAAASALCGNAQATGEHMALALAIFGAVGETVVVGEAQMHAVTGLSGSGPAYVFTLIEAMAAGGVKMGLTVEAARKLAAQTFLGAARLALESGVSPADLRDQVTTPGGTTVAGLHELERGGVRSAMMDAVEAATERSIELTELLYGHEQA